MSQHAPEIHLTGRIAGRKLQMRKPKDLERQLAKFPASCEVSIRIKQLSAIRSLEQNSLYWSGYVQPLSEHTGYTSDEIHAFLKAKFLPKKLAFCDGNGEVIGEYVVGGTTTTLNKIEFGEYLCHIEEWAATELGVMVGTNA